MKTFKSLILSAVTAAATLGTVVMSAPAQACPLCNGVKLNSPVINGIFLNDIKFNGWKINGFRVNGVQFNGLQFNGFQLNGLRVNGAALNASVAAGQPVAVTLADGSTLALK